MTIYLISGLGADERVFGKLAFPDSYNVVCLPWIKPLFKESLKQYALRLAEKIDTSAPFYLIGLSFGGMIASEIAEHLNPVKTILISSISTSNQLPWYYKLGGRLKLHRALPYKSLLQIANRAFRIFGSRKGDTQKVVEQIIQNLDPAFADWAIDAILCWKKENKPKNIIHIHGTWDKLLPCRFTEADIRIRRGGHLIVYDRAADISAWIRSIILPDQN